MERPGPKKRTRKWIMDRELLTFDASDPLAEDGIHAVAGGSMPEGVAIKEDGSSTSGTAVVIVKVMSEKAFADFAPGTGCPIATPGWPCRGDTLGHGAGGQ